MREFLQRFAEAVVTLIEKANGFHDQVIGLRRTGGFGLSGQTLQLTCVVSVVTGHILHQSVQLFHRLRRGSSMFMMVVVMMRMLMIMAVRRIVLVKMLVLMRMGVDCTVGMGVFVGMLVIMLVVVIGHNMLYPPKRFL